MRGKAHTLRLRAHRCMDMRSDTPDANLNFSFPGIQESHLHVAVPQ